MHITEFLKTHTNIKVEIKVEEPAKIHIIVTVDNLKLEEIIDGRNLKPGDVESKWFKMIDKIVEKQNEVAASNNS